MDVTKPALRRRKDCGDGLLIFQHAHYRQSPGISLPRGLSLIEILVVLTLVLLLSGLTAPSFQQLLVSHRLTSHTNTLTASLALTRAEAVKRGHNVILCKSPDGQQCHSQSRWEDGWMVYADRNHNRQRDPDEPVLYHHQSINVGLEVDYAAFGSHHHVIYHPTGYALTNGTFTLCHPDYPDLARTLILAKSGRVRLSQTRADGKPVACGKP